MQTSGISSVLEVSIVPSSTQYTANDVVGGLLTVGPIQGMDGGMMLNAIDLMDSDNEGAVIDVYVFDKQPSAIADHDAFAPTFADLQKLALKVEIAAADYKTINSLKWVRKEDLNHFIPDTSKVWIYLVAVATPTYAANKAITLRLFVAS